MLRPYAAYAATYLDDVIIHSGGWAKHMTDLTRKGASDLVQWTEPCQLAFEKVKQGLCGEPPLHKLHFSIPFLLQTNRFSRMAPQPTSGSGSMWW